MAVSHGAASNFDPEMREVDEGGCGDGSVSG